LPVYWTDKTLIVDIVDSALPSKRDAHNVLYVEVPLSIIIDSNKEIYCYIECSESAISCKPSDILATSQEQHVPFDFVSLKLYYANK